MLLSVSFSSRCFFSIHWAKLALIFLIFFLYFWRKGMRLGHVFLWFKQDFKRPVKLTEGVWTKTLYHFVPFETFFSLLTVDVGAIFLYLKFYFFFWKCLHSFTSNWIADKYTLPVAYSNFFLLEKFLRGLKHLLLCYLNNQYYDENQTKQTATTTNPPTSIWRSHNILWTLLLNFVSFEFLENKVESRNSLIHLLVSKPVFFYFLFQMSDGKTNSGGSPWKLFQLAQRM